MTGGVDTVSLAWRPRTEAVFDRFRQEPHRYGPAGSLILNERGPGDERLILFPGHGVLTMEGRLGAILARDERNHDLVPSERVRACETACERVLGDVLAYRPDDHTICEVRRYDLASELRFEDGREGLAMLRTLAGMCPPGARTTIERRDGQDMTVYVRTPKRGVVLQRFYDKGLESGSDAPGRRIRLEAQLRPPKSKRLAPETLARLDLRSHFIGRMASYVNDTNASGVVAAGSEAAVDTLVGQVARDELSMAKAERLVGSLTLLRRHGRAIYEDRQGRRRLADLRAAGVALEHELPPDRVVPVGELLRQAMEDFSS